MQEFNLQIFHKPGKEMVVPDALIKNVWEYSD